MYTVLRIGAGLESCHVTSTGAVLVGKRSAVHRYRRQVPVGSGCAAEAHYDDASGARMKFFNHV